MRGKHDIILYESGCSNNVSNDAWKNYIMRKHDIIITIEN